MSASLPRVDPLDGTVATAMELRNTLLESAVKMQRARFVRNSAVRWLPLVTACLLATPAHAGNTQK